MARSNKIETKVERKTKHVLHSTQSILPIADIRDGIIITKDAHFVKILEVFPVNFIYKPDREQDKIINDFSSVLSVSPNNVQIKVLSRKADTRQQIAILKEDMAKENNPACKELQRNYIELLERIPDDSTISRRFFYIISYEKQNPSEKTTFEMAKRSLMNSAYKIRVSFSACGNEVVDIIDNSLLKTTLNSATILYDLLNRRKSKITTFEDHASTVENRYKEKYDRPVIPINDFIAPKNIVLTEGSYAYIDGVYYTYAAIKTYPIGNYCGGWVMNIMPQIEGIDVDIFLKRVPTRDALKSLRLHTNVLDSSLPDKSSKSETFRVMSKARNSAAYYEQALTGDSRNEMYTYCVLYTVSAESLEELEAKYDELVTMVHIKNKFKVVRLSFLMTEAFTSTLPLCNLNPDIRAICEQDCVTDFASSLYPFTAAELCDPHGIYFGRNEANGSIVSPDLFNRAKYPASNIFIAGTTGMGKSFSLITMALRFRLKQIPVTLIAPVKGNEFSRACKAVGGTFISLGKNNNRINPLGIIPYDTTHNHEIDEDEDEEDTSLLTLKCEYLKNIFRMLKPDLDAYEVQAVEDSIIELYNSFGITHDNASLYDANHNLKPMPIISDWQNILRRRNDKLATLLNTFVVGAGSAFNGQTNVSLDNMFKVIDLTPLSKANQEILSISMYIAMDYVRTEAQADRTQKKVIMIDEWWTMAYHPLAAEASLDLARLIRAANGMVVFATQRLADIFGVENGKYGEGVLSCCRIKILLGIAADEMNKIIKSGLLPLTEQEQTQIVRFARGEMLFSDNGNNFVMTLEASPEEEYLATTDINRLNELRMELRQKQSIFD